MAQSVDFFSEYGEGSRYVVQEMVGKGSYGVVCSAVDTSTGQKVAIKKMTNVFEHVSDATRILREIKLLRLLRHPDIVEIKHIMLPPCSRKFKDVYVVFELMESDLHQVIKANRDLTPRHYQFFLYQLLRAMKYLHTANVFHRDLKPKNVLANADCNLKICDFGLARVAFNDTSTSVFWTDYVATRWYRAPELCGSFFSKYTPAVDIWSVGCIFAEVLMGRPLFPGKNVVHQLDLITDILGTPPTDAISRIRNDKARKYLASMRKKSAISFAQKFPKADPLALRLLGRLLAFDPKDRPSAEQALADPYFIGLARKEREPSAQPIIKLEFEFEKRRMSKEDVRDLIYKEILEYHPQMQKDHLLGTDNVHYVYPSSMGLFKKQFNHLEEHYDKGYPCEPLEREHSSLPRERPSEMRAAVSCYEREKQERGLNNVMKMTAKAHTVLQGGHAKPGRVFGSGLERPSGSKTDTHLQRLVKSSNVSGSLHDKSGQLYPRQSLCVDLEKNVRKEESSSEKINANFPRPRMNEHVLPHKEELSIDNTNTIRPSSSMNWHLLHHRDESSSENTNLIPSRSSMNGHLLPRRGC
ncbi:hypothetical protein SUGI_0477480 [Cryptomeria japonica]|uniref:mitogen-activated protein kinase 15 n=1 Tax=Cryptomeria japonica TaxID=3369 RepID=UPI002408E679|nr:mitogen-activated protein kinase 15 [Cryptomeria japonica]GLJ24949.1 hypothetical protein SUGI_0477480 [Cryptomeria japonica]